MSDPEGGRWWESLYDEVLADVLLERADPAEVESTVRFLVEALRLPADAAVFDQCCGIGSLSVPLAATGREVFGVDQAGAYVERARRAADAAGVRCHLEVGDAFEHTPPRPCHGAFNWWTSFGYEARDEDNLRMLRRAFEALRPGGRFALDFMNVPAVLRGFEPRVELSRPTPGGTSTIIRESEIDLLTGTMKKRWIHVRPDGCRSEHPSAVRMYTPDNLHRLLLQAGFREITAYGGVDGSALGLDSPRCVLVAERPG